MSDGRPVRGTSRRRWVTLAAVVAVGLMVALPVFACTPSAQISVRPDEAAAGAVVNMSGTHFDPAGAAVNIHWGGGSGPVLATAEVAENGTFTQQVTIPAEASPGFSSLTATQQAGDTTWHAHFAFSVAGEEPADEPAEQEEPSNAEEGTPEGGTAPDPADEPAEQEEPSNAEEGTPEGGTAPEPAPEPDGESAPEPAPEPDGESAPEPAPEPAPGPDGESAPEPAPEPDGQPAAEPAPEPQGQTGPDPQPAPAPPPEPQPAPQAAATAPNGEPTADPVVRAGSGTVDAAAFPREMLDARGDGPAVAADNAARFDSPAVPQEIRDAQGQPDATAAADRADAGTESSAAAEEPQAAPASPDVGPSPWFLVPLGLLALGTLAMGLGTFAHELKRKTAKAKM